MKTLLRLNLVLALAALLITSFALGIPRAANAYSLSDNLGGITVYSDPIGSGNTDYWAASSFSTGVGDHQAYTLTSVTLSATGDALAVEVDLYSSLGTPGISGTPNEFKGALTHSSDTTYTTSGLSLAADAYYWIVVKPASEGTLSWNVDGASGSGPGLLLSWAYTNNAGSSWDGYNGSDFPYFYQMQVNATPTPIPGSVLLTGSGLLGLLGLRLRLRKKA